MPYAPYDRSPNDPNATINYGQSRDFYQVVSVSTVGTFNTDCDVIIPFTTQGVMLYNLSATTGTFTVEFSCNGNAVHGVLNNTNGTAGLTFDSRVMSKIWFRVQSGSTAPVNVSVLAWATH
jgi:hypothetical protein